MGGLLPRLGSPLLTLRGTLRASGTFDAVLIPTASRAGLVPEERDGWRVFCSTQTTRTRELPGAPIVGSHQPATVCPIPRVICPTAPPLPTHPRITT